MHVDSQSIAVSEIYYLQGWRMSGKSDLGATIANSGRVPPLVIAVPIFFGVIDTFVVESLVDSYNDRATYWGRNVSSDLDRKAKRVIVGG
jgi:hypothetical protein